MRLTHKEPSTQTMFGQSKPVVFERYGRRRSRWRIPPWMLLLLVGIGLGVAAVLFAQERYLPPRLSASASTELRRAFEEADATRHRLTVQLADMGEKLESTLAEKKTLADELAKAQAGMAALRTDLASVVASMPADPRGGAVQIRAGWFSLKGPVLTYDLVLTRDRDVSAPLAASLQFAVTGETLAGTPRSASPQPVAVSIAAQQILRGSVNLPVDFKPQQVTIQVVDKNSGKLQGMRVFIVKP